MPPAGAMAGPTHARLRMNLRRRRRTVGRLLEGRSGRRGVGLAPRVDGLLCGCVGLGLSRWSWGPCCLGGDCACQRRSLGFRSPAAARITGVAVFGKLLLATATPLERVSFDRQFGPSMACWATSKIAAAWIFAWTRTHKVATPTLFQGRWTMLDVASGLLGAGGWGASRRL